MYLQLSGKLNQYLNMHFSCLYIFHINFFRASYCAAHRLDEKKMKVHSHLTRVVRQNLLKYLALVVPLIVALFFPTVNLDSTTVSAKGYHFPLTDGIQRASWPDRQPEAWPPVPILLKSAYGNAGSCKKYLKMSSPLRPVWKLYGMEVLYDYQIDCRKRLEFTGFVYNGPSDTTASFFSVSVLSAYRRFGSLLMDFWQLVIRSILKIIPG